MNHLTEADILLFLENNISDEEQPKYERHLAECDICRERLVEIYQLEDRLSSSQPPNIEPETLDKAKKLIQEDKSDNYALNLFQRFSTAAIFLIAVLLTLWVWRGDEFMNPKDEFRSGDTSTLVQPLTPEDGTSILYHDSEFTWKPVENAAYYRLVIFSDNGVELWSQQVKSTEKALPANISMEPESHYLWKVEAVMPDGIIVSSPLQSFHLEKK